MKPSTPFFSYYDVLEACAKPGCPFCRLAEKTVNRYLGALMYEQVNDPGTRAVLHQSFGFCNEHAFRLPETGGGPASGIAIIYRDLLGRISDRLKEGRFVHRNRLSVQQMQETFDPDRPAAATMVAVRSLLPRAECPACLHRDEMIAIALQAMLESLATDERMRAALKSSSGLCLPHLRRAFELTRDEATFGLLSAIAREQLDQLLRELDEFIRKCDYRFNQLGFGPERDSWRRALEWLVSARGV